MSSVKSMNYGLFTLEVTQMVSALMGDSGAAGDKSFTSPVESSSDEDNYENS